MQAPGPGKMALAMEPADLSSIPGTHVVDSDHTH